MISFTVLDGDGVDYYTLCNWCKFANEDDSNLPVGVFPRACQHVYDCVFYKKHHYIPHARYWYHRRPTTRMCGFFVKSTRQLRFNNHKEYFRRWGMDVD